MLMRARAVSAGALILAGPAAACSPKQFGINRMAAALADASSVYDNDNDPEFVRLAAPSTLKTIEMLLSQSPKHPTLLLTACSGFTQVLIRVPPRRGGGQDRRRGGGQGTEGARRQDV